MNRERAKALLPIIQGYADGKTVQRLEVCGWTDIESPSFEWGIGHYRIKPAPLECWVTMDRFKFKLAHSTEADAKIFAARSEYAPYTIHHMREVTE